MIPLTNITSVTNDYICDSLHESVPLTAGDSDRQGHAVLKRLASTFGLYGAGNEELLTVVATYFWEVWDVAVEAARSGEDHENDQT